MENNLIVKNNDLIEARYDLNIVEQKIILYSVSKIDTNKNNFNMISLEVKELSRMMGTEIDRYSEFSRIANGLMDRRIYFKDRPNLDVRWLASSEYVGNGVIELEFSEKLVPYLLQLKEKFTRYQLKNIINLKKKHSLRIYELLKQYEVIGKRKFEIETLKRILYIDNQYERVYDFERFVLKESKKEINEHTDIIISYEKIKTGRKVTDILFKINSKNKEEEKFTNDIQELKIKMGLKDSKFDEKQILNIYEKAIERAGNEDIDIYEYIRLNYIHIKDKARNRYSYLLKAVEHDYACAINQISLDYYIDK